MMKIPFHGGCACGKVRYEVHAEPLMTGICHCRECQRSGGTESAPNFMVPASAVRFTGEAAFREYTADSGSRVRHYFCRDCGSALFGRSSAMSDGIAIRAASLDDPSWFRPQFHVFTASAQPWVRIPAELPSFPGMPPMAAAPDAAGRR